MNERQIKGQQIAQTKKIVYDPKKNGWIVLFKRSIHSFRAEGHTRFIRMLKAKSKSVKHRVTT